VPQEGPLEQRLSKHLRRYAAGSFPPPIMALERLAARNSVRAYSKSPCLAASTAASAKMSGRESRDMESYLPIDFRYSFNEMQVNHMPPPTNATIVPPATNRNKIAPKFESMLSIELSFRPLVKGERSGLECVNRPVGARERGPRHEANNQKHADAMWAPGYFKPRTKLQI
jgi:hypothetical protein